MASPALRTDFTDQSTPGSNDLAAAEYNLNATRTDVAFDLASAAVQPGGANTLTNTRVRPRVNTVASSATPSINTDTTDLFTITALAVAITSMTTNLTGTPTEGQELWIRFKDNGTARAIAWGASFISSGTQTLLATTSISKTHVVRLKYDSVVVKWVCMFVDATGY